MPSRRAHVIDLLSAYDPDDLDEREYRRLMLDLAASAADPFSRFEYTPGHFTASGFVVHPAGERILLVHHELLDIWVQPGGHIEIDDLTPLEAAMREVAEECGLEGLHPVSSGLVDIDIHVFPERSDQPRHLHFDLRFGFVAASDRVRPLDGTIEVLWVSGTDLQALGVDRSVVRPASKLLGLG